MKCSLFFRIFSQDIQIASDKVFGVPSQKLTYLPENKPFAPKGKNRLPTVDFREFFWFAARKHLQTGPLFVERPQFDEHIFEMGDSTTPEAPKHCFRTSSKQRSKPWLDV